MRSVSSALLLVTILSLTLNGCRPGPSSTAAPDVHTLTPVPPTATPVPSTPTLALPTTTAVLQGMIIIVTSTADTGSGTLRQALLDAQSGDIITFDPAVFPSIAPATIYVNSELPPISQDHLTIDASNVGVILDGSNIGEHFVPGLQVVSNWNTVQGLQVINFSGAGIVLSGGAQNNTIGGDRNIGSGPLGLGNLTNSNNMGIGLWDDGTSYNTIVGNLIGTDVVLAERGNHWTGIYIAEGASHNMIGPDNVVAYNDEQGIQIYNSNSLGNTITQNSIHDNGIFGIYLNDGGNTELIAPLLFDFYLSTGTLAGTTCAICTVEIFSDNNNSGRIYEGRTTSDSNGAFMFDKGASFTGPRLTATTTDNDGNTSQFSAPTSGTSKTLILQEGNDLPRTLLRTKQSGDLEDNRIGSVGMSDMADPFGQPGDLQHTITVVANMGLKHFRFTIVNIDGDRVDWDKPEYIFEPRHHDFISGMAENGVMVKYLLIFRDDALGGEGRAYHPRFKTEEEIQRYLDYVRFIISNVKDRVPYFEIWNEPNIGDSVQWIEVEDYINLVRRVVPVIRQEYPEAKIMLAGTTYLREAESRDYLFSILRSDVMPLVDVISWHPMFGASPEIHSDYYYEYPSIVQEIMDTASTHGFTGEYEAGEISWWTEPESEAQESGIWYSEVAAAKYHARGTVMHLGMDVRVTHGAVPSGLPSRQLVDTAITNLCTIMAGAEATSLPVEIEATNVMSYSFSLPNGDYLVALWTDGVAVDDDPGINVTLILPDFSVGEVWGIDVLYSFEQQIIADTKNGNLVMRDLLVKDYPIILRFTDSSSP
jgi:hypothetical protein